MDIDKALEWANQIESYYKKKHGDALTLDKVLGTDDKCILVLAEAVERLRYNFKVQATKSGAVMAELDITRKGFECQYSEIKRLRKAVKLFQDATDCTCYMLPDHHCVLCAAQEILAEKL